MTGARKHRRIQVEVAYALPGEQVLLHLEVVEGATAREAVEQSGILQRYPEIDPARAALGVFGRVVPPDTRVRNGDRVEIYRPLIADPKQGRRERAKKESTRR